MILSWFRGRRRRKLLARPFPEHWTRYLETLPFYPTLEEAEQKDLRGIVRVLVAEKHWEGCGGLELTDEIKVTIAAQAALLVLHVDHDYYRKLQSILVYPSTYVGQARHAGPGGHLIESATPTLGEAWLNGPVVLSWDSVRQGAENWKDGHNVVLHEFAHRLDMLDGVADGTPILETGEQYEAWHRLMTREFETLEQDLESGRRTLLDRYAATNVAEFFAVATECFFEMPLRMLAEHPDLYEVLRAFYRQDPAART